MTFSRDSSGAACLGGTSLRRLLDGGLPTPAYVYDLDAVAEAARELEAGFGDQDHLVCYAVKANSAGPIIRALAAEGCGADVVSGAELQLAMACGVPPSNIVYSGVAKRDDELELALGAGGRGAILSTQVESVEEIPRIEKIAARLGRRAPVSLRINPGVEADTHAHIATGHDEAKFGIPRADLERAFDALREAKHVDLIGLSSHVGSQLTSTDAYMTSARVLLDLATVAETALTRRLSYIDFGGGFGIDYGTGCPVRPRDFAALAVQAVRASNRSETRILCEPGRSMVAAFGALVSRVIMRKIARPSGVMREWLMIDAGMNDLIRPALYQALHRIEPVECPPPEGAYGADVRVVGPVCESSDDFGTHPMPPSGFDHVVIRDAGAYGFTMASQYNGRALPTEVFLSKGDIVARLDGTTSAAWIASRTG